MLVSTSYFLDGKIKTQQESNLINTEIIPIKNFPRNQNKMESLLSASCDFL